MGKVKDLTGMTFGHWTVLYAVENDKNGHRQYMCECDCAKRTRRKVLATYLVNGKSTCCGCVKNRPKRNKRTVNEYIFHKDYIEGLGNLGKSFYIDYEDYEKVKDLKWTCNSKGYWAHHELHEKSILLHRYIMETDKEVLVDHKDQNPCNNRRKNLRITNVQNNRFNTKPSIINKSGVIGVSESKTEGKWVASIKINGKKIHLGTFSSKEEAILARLKAEIKYIDIEYAPNRHLFAKFNLI